MQKQSKILIYIAAAILIALTVLGSLFDFEIANALYIGQTPRDNLFAIILSYVGIIPTFVGWSFLGTIIICQAKKQVENTKKRRWIIAFGVLLFVLSFFYFCNTIFVSNLNVLKVHFLIAYGVGVAVICAAAYLGYLLCIKSQSAQLFKDALFLAVVSLIVLVLVSATKNIMCRPRYRFYLATNDTVYLKSWWQSGRALKESLGAGIDNDEFTSFPSGHSAYSMFAIFIFPFIADFVSGLKKYKPLFFAFGFVWWTVTALSRMTAGAHYLTDVAFAGLVTILAYTAASLVKRLYLKRKTTNK